MLCTCLHSFTPVWIFPVFLWFFCSHNSHPSRNLPKWKSTAKKGNFYWWVLLHAKPTPTRTQYQDHKTVINLSRLESFAIYIALLRSFSLLGHMLSENVSSDDVRSQQRSEEILVVLLRSHVIGQVTQTVQKSGQKADYIQCRARLACFAARKIAKIGGKLWQLDSIMYITHIHVRGHKILSMEPFMRLLVCECGYHWRLRVNTCAKVDGVHHPQGKESECMSCCHDAL